MSGRTYTLGRDCRFCEPKTYRFLNGERRQDNSAISDLTHNRRLEYETYYCKSIFQKDTERNYTIVTAF